MVNVSMCENLLALPLLPPSAFVTGVMLGSLGNKGLCVLESGFFYISCVNILIFFLLVWYIIYQNH